MYHLFVPSFLPTESFAIAILPLSSALLSFPSNYITPIKYKHAIISHIVKKKGKKKTLFTPFPSIFHAISLSLSTVILLEKVVYSPCLNSSPLVYSEMHLSLVLSHSHTETMLIKIISDVIVLNPMAIMQL